MHAQLVPNQPLHQRIAEPRPRLLDGRPSLRYDVLERLPELRERVCISILLEIPLDRLPPDLKPSLLFRPVRAREQHAAVLVLEIIRRPLVCYLLHHRLPVVLGRHERRKDFDRGGTGVPTLRGE